MASKSTKRNEIVGLKNLRENMEVYIKRVQEGESLTVMRRNQALFRITPLDEDYESDWETVVDFTKETGRGVPIEELLASMKKMHG